MNVLDSVSYNTWRLGLSDVQLLYSLCTLVYRPIDRGCNCQSSANDSAQSDQEAGEGLASDFSVDDFHRRYVLSFQFRWCSEQKKRLYGREKNKKMRTCIRKIDELEQL